MKRTLIPLLVLLAASFSARAQVLMGGDIEYWIHGSRFHLEIDGVTNFEDTTTNPLRFRVWAGDYHWSQYHRGDLVAFGRLARVKPNATVINVHSTVHMHYPDNGWYHITITLEEKTVDSTGTHWVLRDAITFDHEDYLGHSWHPWPF